MSFYSWRPYVPVAQRRANAHKEMEKLRKKGKNIQPVELDGKKIAASFWGKGWCDHLESFSDYENRLPRGRTYVRNGSVCHLEIRAGHIEAFVCGSDLYKVAVEITPLANKTWQAIKKKCQGQIGSMLELLQGKVSNHVMEIVSHREEGLFPQPGEMQLTCSCPDWATMCKHVAAVLYGVGNRLDHEPELLFFLRGVDASELITAEVGLLTRAAATEETLAESALADIFGVDVETGGTAAETPMKRRKAAAPRKPKTVKQSVPETPVQHAAPKAAKAKKPARNAATQKTKKPGKTAVKKKTAPVIAFDPNAPTGAAIAQLRKKTGFSTAGFARALRVSEQSVQRWESIPGLVGLRPRALAALIALQKQLDSK